MKLSLFGRKLSREEIEREATEEIEALVRGGDKPPPPSWTLADGLPVDAPAEPEPAAPAAPAEAAASDEPPPAPPARPRATKRTRSGKSRATSAGRS